MSTGDVIKTVQEKFRDDFPTSDRNALWEVAQIGTGQSVDWNTTSALRVLAGTTAGAETVIRSTRGWGGAFRVQFAALAASLISQRVANQAIELRVCTRDGKEVAGWVFDGTGATTGKIRSANGGVMPADTSVTVPDTNTGSPIFEIELTPDEVWWHCRIADNVAGRSNSYVRNRQVPDPNTELFIEIRVRNNAAASGNTVLALDCVMVQDISELTTEITGGRGGAGLANAVPVAVLGTSTVTGTVNLGTGGTAATSLGKAEDAAHTSGDVGVAIWGVRQGSPAAATSAAGDYSPILTDAEGKVIVAGSADPGVTVQSVTDLTLASAAAILAAGAAGQRAYITDLTLENTGAAANRVTISDGATRIFSATVPAGATVTKAFSTPLKGTAATVVNATLGAAGTVTVSLSGYRGV